MALRNNSRGMGTKLAKCLSVMVDYELVVRPNVRYLNNRSVVLGDTVLLCNQLGYVFQNEHLIFDGKACFEPLKAP